MNEIRVSVCCITYNQEKYIQDALESFVNQVTDFEYEVLVHDDASTDNTPSIIEEYAKKYPHIIKPIYQEENQYTKGKQILQTFVFPKTKGRYIALCEGDDYWCDLNKLQKQIDYLETHQEYSACVHNTRGIQCRQHNKVKILYESKVDRDISLDEVLEGGCAYFHTSSIVFRSKYKNRPPEFFANGFGDYPMAIHLALNGKIHYFKDVMSVYRILADGSWSSKLLSENSIESAIAIRRECIGLLNRIDVFTNGEFHESIAYPIRLNNYYIEGAMGNFRVQLREYNDVVHRLGLGEKIKLYIKCIFPASIKIKEKIGKRKIAKR